MTKSVTQYLSTYAEVEAQIATSILLTENEKRQFDHVVVIPAYKESDDFIDQYLNTSLKVNRLLIIVVVNQPDTDNNNLPQQVLFQSLLSKGRLIKSQHNVSFIDCQMRTEKFDVNNDACSRSILLIDRFTQVIKEKQGVGLARKIGADIALNLISENIVISPFIASTDADATLPSHYFTVLSQAKDIHAAVTFNFHHQSTDKKIEQANALYELSLRYYVAGLMYANSPYAFFTIGSVIAVNHHHYAQARGFPKRNAGEDFYLLNKLAKLGSVVYEPNCIVNIIARTSNRVPFGTGPAVEKILNLSEQHLKYKSYHPSVFQHLKQVLIHFQTLFEYRYNIDAWLQLLSPIEQKAIRQSGIVEFTSKHLTNSEKQFNKQLSIWFDAFKTLRFIHLLRDLGVNDIPLNDAIIKSGFKFSKN